MPLYVASGADAANNLYRNRFSRWHQNGARADESQGELAFQRLQKSFFTPGVIPAFRVQRTDKLFAIGSCFARGIERALLGRKMEVVSASTDFDIFQTINPEVTGLGFTNKYNTYSIRNELEWALDPAARFPLESIIDLGEGIWYDPHTNPALPFAGRDETLQRRSILQNVNARIAHCRLVIITLGLVEIWRDTETNIFINTTPPAGAITRYPGRYEFQVSNFSENFANLEAIHGILSRFGHPEARIIVTVSPVPLMATFTQEDVVLANCYSKSSLRAAAQEWAAAHENVDYFPSYEMVMNSARDTAWVEDLRHVQGNLINHIMQFFLKQYLE